MFIFGCSQTRVDATKVPKMQPLKREMVQSWHWLECSNALIAWVLSDEIAATDTVDKRALIWWPRTLAKRRATSGAKPTTRAKSEASTHG